MVKSLNESKLAILVTSSKVNLKEPDAEIAVPLLDITITGAVIVNAVHPVAVSCLAVIAKTFIFLKEEYDMDMVFAEVTGEDL